MSASSEQRWADAVRAAALAALDPRGLGGVLLHAHPGPVRERWLAALRAMLPEETPFLRVPLHIDAATMDGALDIAATLASGRAAYHAGLLERGRGGFLVAAMAERMQAGIAARIACALDAGADIGVIALDEGLDVEERAPAVLRERLALHIELEGIPVRAAEKAAPERRALAAARARIAQVRAGAEIAEALVSAAAALGIASLRVPLLALRAACAAAALAGRNGVAEEDAALAARLVLAPRARRLPPAEESRAPEESETREAPPAGSEATSRPPLEERVLEAVRAVLPPGLLFESTELGASGREPGAGRRGRPQSPARRGRPAGVRAGKPGCGARLNIVETLRAAVPWQRLRRRLEGQRIAVRPSDLRVNRHRQRTAATTIFAVDASGSTALQRLAEAKGAIELLLEQNYVRRDRVALVAFRGARAQVLLSPTRALVRARRCLAALPGGGGTPLAAGIVAATRIADQVRRAGDKPIVVLLTDGRANVALDGAGSRARAREDALAAARRLRAAGIAAIVIDTAPRPEPLAREIAEAMRARYLALPFADAQTVARAISAPAE